MCAIRMARRVSSVAAGRAPSPWGLSERDWYLDENADPRDQLFVRLNAIGNMRNSEHEDLVAGLPRPFTIYEIE